MGEVWTFEALLAHLTAQIETLHHEVEGRESLWRKEYDAKIDGLRCHADDHWLRTVAQDEDLHQAMDREDRNLGHRIDDLAHRIDDLRRYHDDSVRQTERFIQATLDASDKAIGKAETATERRLEALAGAMSRDEYGAQHAALVDRVNALQTRIERAEGQGIGRSQMWAYVVAIITVLGTVVIMANVFLDHALS